jgi:hypothetical protein
MLAMRFEWDDSKDAENQLRMLCTTQRELVQRGSGWDATQTCIGIVAGRPQADFSHPALG